MAAAFLTETEINQARAFVETALKLGANKCRVTLTKSVMDLVGILDGKVDKITHSMDRSITLALFADGRYGTFSTNRLEEGIEEFVAKALQTVAMMAPDKYRDLPAPQRTARGCDNLELCDAASYESMTMDARIALALKGSVFGSHPDIISEEGEYSDTISDICIIDSNGTFCRQREGSFDFANEITVKDGDAKTSAYWWESSRKAEDLDTESVGKEALRQALAKRDAKFCTGRAMTMIVHSECASKLLTPLLNAMNGYAIQQNNSFLAGKLGEKIFPDFLNIVDRPLEKGAFGSRTFDSEGVACKDMPIIEKGQLKTWFISTYMGAKMDMEPNVDDASRPCIESTVAKDVKALVEDCKAGYAGGDKGTILVTGFNGGNSNSATGDFSFGIEGFYYGPDGSFPVREMVITGNLLELWNNLYAVGNDPRPARPRVIPSLVFKNVIFS